MSPMPKYILNVGSDLEAGLLVSWGRYSDKDK